MKRILKLLFNLTRTLSLILVLGVIAFFTYFYYNGDIDKLLDQIEQEAMRRKGSVQQQVLTGRNYSLGDELIPEEKLALRADRSTHFIFPDQVAFFSTQGGGTISVTTQGDTISGITNSLSSIWNSLAKRQENSFFKTQSALINCRHVRQYLPQNMAGPGRSNYVYHLIMDTGDTLIIPKDKSRPFLEEMERLSLIID